MGVLAASRRGEARARRSDAKVVVSRRDKKESIA
jgi:hypothetical protein